jgi:DNA-binding MarR family transcriptional regulator
MARHRAGKESASHVSAGARRTELALFDLFWELASTYFRLNAAGARIAARAQLTPGKISILRSVRDAGPQSVAQMARDRPVARQGVQVMADQLVAAGYAKYVDNPSHRRAKLLCVTPKGSALLDRMLEAQMELARSLASNFRRDELASAVGVIRRLREVLAP